MNIADAEFCTFKKKINMDTAYVKSHIEHGINTIEFFHPQSNSLPGKILEELAKEIHFAGTHGDTEVGGRERCGCLHLRDADT